MTRATVFAAMTFTEFLTIYLSIGAPFGVYYFFKKRTDFVNLTLILKSVGAALVWFLFAARLIGNSLFSIQRARSKANLDFLRPNKIEVVSQNLQNAFAKLSSPDASTISFFEFRETLERYIGLALAVQSSSENAPVPKHELEVFRVVNFKKSDLQLAGKILHRKNYLRLQRHQERARHDFLQIYQFLQESLGAEVNGKLAAWQEYQTEALRLSELLRDVETTRIFRKSCQTCAAEQSSVFEANGNQERDLWKTLQSPASIKTFPMTTPTQLMTTRRSRD